MQYKGCCNTDLGGTIFNKVFSINLSTISYLFHKTDAETDWRRSICFLLDVIHVKKKTSHSNQQSTNHSIQEQLHSCGETCDCESVAPEHQWGGSIVTDEHSGVTSASERRCHVQPSSKRLTGCTDVRVLWLTPSANACGLSLTLNGQSWVQHDDHVTQKKPRFRCEVLNYHILRKFIVHVQSRDGKLNTDISKLCHDSKAIILKHDTGKTWQKLTRRKSRSHNVKIPFIVTSMIGWKDVPIRRDA